MTEHESLCGDILRVLSFDGLTDDQRAMAVAALKARIIDAIGRMSIHGLQHLARCADAAEHNQGCVSPAEHLIEELVDRHYTSGLNPADVEYQLEEFQRNYDEMQQTVARHAEMYPDGSS